MFSYLKFRGDRSVSDSIDFTLILIINTPKGL